MRLVCQLLPSGACGKAVLVVLLRCHALPPTPGNPSRERSSLLLMLKLKLTARPTREAIKRSGPPRCLEMLFAPVSSRHP